MASLKVKILTNVTCRRIKGADVYFATAVSDANELVNLSTSEVWITEKLHKDQFFTLLKVNTRKRDVDAVDVTLYEDSRVVIQFNFIAHIKYVCIIVSRSSQISYHFFG